MNNDNLIRNEEIMEVDDPELDGSIIEDVNLVSEESNYEEADLFNSECNSKEKFKIYEPSKFESIDIKTSTRSSGSVGVMSIINSNGCGKRVTISREVTNKIGNPDFVTIGFGENEISILMTPTNSKNGFKLGRIGAKGVVYSAGLVDALTDRYNLDFDDRVSITFDKVEYKTAGDNLVAVIAMV